jgi:hypothetical protein
MAHEDAGHYAAKHPSGTKVDPSIKQKLETKLSAGKIRCAAAHAIAEELGAPPADVGVAIDLMEARIAKCQLGLFGYHPEKRIVKPAASPSPDIEDAVKRHLENGRITCKNCWQIAERAGLKKMDISNICEQLGIKVAKCQLGAF